MVWLAKSILETIPNGRVLIITDRTELDEQIEKVFNGVNEDIRRTQSGAHLLQVLTNPAERLICSLVHKFGRSGEREDEDTDTDDYDDYLDDLQQHLPDGFQTKGEFFVFVDECHRTQSGKLHSATSRNARNSINSLPPLCVLMPISPTICARRVTVPMRHERLRQR